MCPPPGVLGHGWSTVRLPQVEGSANRTRTDASRLVTVCSVRLGPRDDDAVWMLVRRGTTTHTTIHVDSCGSLLTTVAGKHWRGDAPGAWWNDSDHTGTFHALTSSKGTFTGDDKVVITLYQRRACRVSDR